MVVSRFRIDAGRSFPPGATVTPEGVNFSIFSRHATAATLLLFGDDDDVQPIQTIELDPETNRTFFFWHVLVVGAEAGLQFTWRMDGPPGDGVNGFRIDRRHQLLDPWARLVSTTHWDRQAVLDDPETSGTFRAVVEADAYDWENDQPVNHALQDSVIYELHVGGFTRHPTSGVDGAGTFRGLIEKIPYLQSLGVTDVELLPVMAFDAQDVPADTASLG
ncbi:MAG: glycogen debranching enzyme, partial [Gammaproteobacteria bacterium]